MLLAQFSTEEYCERYIFRDPSVEILLPQTIDYVKRRNSELKGKNIPSEDRAHILSLDIVKRLEPYLAVDIEDSIRQTVGMFVGLAL